MAGTCEEWTVIERMVGKLTGKLLLWAARRALRIGDIHEFNHIGWAIKLGNTAKCSAGDCTLDHLGLKPLRTKR
jgi:hypothetical protein